MTAASCPGSVDHYKAYAWLQEHFGISEEDVQWQDVLSDWEGTLEEDIADLDEDEKCR